MGKKRTFRLNKIVRDGVLENMLQTGQKPRYKQLKGTAGIKALAGKIVEETEEAAADGKEWADVMQASEDFQKAVGLHLKKLGLEEETKAQQVKKRESVGGFSKVAYVEEIELDESDPWCVYYAADPKRFPEKR